MRNPLVDQYLAIGCLRCPLGNTPECKVHSWQDEFEALRSIVLSCGLTEELKWKMPCYTYEGKNLLIIAAFKDYCGLNMFKGAMIEDSKGLLELPGENSHSARVGRFRNLSQIVENSEVIRDYILQAIEIERSGAEVPKRQPSDLEIPTELAATLDLDPALTAAFFALTPGRQRSHVIFITGAKQSKTREARVEKCIPRILAGKGMLEKSDRDTA